MQAVYYGLRVNVLVLREAAQKAVAERRAQEAKAAQASSTAETPAEVKPEQPGNANTPAPTAGAAGKLWQNCSFLSSSVLPFCRWRAAEGILNFLALFVQEGILSLLKVMLSIAKEQSSIASRHYMKTAIFKSILAAPLSSCNAGPVFLPQIIHSSILESQCAHFWHFEVCQYSWR